MQRRIVVVLLASLAALATAAAAAGRHSAGTIDIGWVGDKSGPTATNQVPGLHGLETYIKWVNDHGGVGGKTINLIEKDDQYNPTLELSAVKSLISDNHVPLISGLGQSTGFDSVLPLFNQNKVIGFPLQAVTKSASYPFQPYVFAGTCNTANQADVMMGYALARLHVKSLKGITIGVGAIQVASGQEMIDEVTKLATKLGAAGVVVDNLAPALLSADVAVQDMQTKGVKIVFLHHSIAGSLAFMRSEDKFNFDVPTIVTSSTTQDAFFTSAPYAVSKTAAGFGCFDPPYLAKGGLSKNIVSVSQKYGVSDSDLRQANYTDGYVNGELIVQGLKNANGDYSAAGIKKGLEKIRNLDTGVTPPLSFTPRCHLAWPNGRLYTYSYKNKGLIPIGSWQQWAKYDTKTYAPPGTCGVPRGAK
jgi:branched-chain amino acid transport system substrate-binding protein